jgi:hypothetical protein
VLRFLGGNNPFSSITRRRRQLSNARRKRTCIQCFALERLEARDLLTSYWISGHFGADFKGDPASGLAYGSFMGTISTTLPAPAGSSGTGLSAFDIVFRNASGAIFDTITSSHPGDLGYTNIKFAGYNRDQITFFNGSTGLQLDFLPPLTGTDPILPTDTVLYRSHGDTRSYTSYVTVTSGSISVDAELDIDGLSQSAKVNPGGLVVMNSDDNNAPRTEITIQKSAYPITLTENGSKVAIFTAATGGQQITFDGAHNVFSSSQLPINLYVQGSQYSNTMRDVELDATAASPIPGADSVKFTDLWVAQPVVATSGTISPGNNKRSEYMNWTVSGTDKLGLQLYNTTYSAIARMGWGTEARATVYPNDFNYPGVTLTLARDGMYHDWIGNGTGTTYEAVFSTLPNANDTGDTEFQDDTPSTNGVIYDFDAPGLYITVAPKGEIQRARCDFKAFVIIKLANNSVVRVSKVTNYFVDFSMVQVAGPKGSDWVVINPPDVKGDDQAGQGAKNITWNLQ